ncbi:MAG: phage Gp37/Gp68 family protein [Pseudomonadota bacterium]
MGDKSGIEWTEATWNPVVGCSILSAGCSRCYAMREAHRLAAKLGIDKYAGTTEETKAGPVWNGTVRLHHPHLDQPLRWKRPRRIFVNSMSDLFHEALSDEDIDKVFAVMALARHHTFQVLTKRSARMLSYLDQPRRRRAWDEAIRTMFGRESVSPPPILPNVWMGVSVEDQAAADARIPDLLSAPAAVRWLSCEPLLGPVDITQYLNTFLKPASIGPSTCPHPLKRLLHWIVCGGESGDRARPMHPDWARSLRDQCAAAGAPFLFKQWGAWTVTYDRDAEDPDWRRCPTARDNRERYLNLAGGHGFHGERVVFVRRAGKKAAGRLLDGVLHDGYPEV